MDIIFKHTKHSEDESKPMKKSPHLEIKLAGREEGSTLSPSTVLDSYMKPIAGHKLQNIWSVDEAMNA